jgi:uncharacterized protein
MHHIIQQLADEIKVKPAQITAAVELLDSGATVPFIARYRKEATQGLDDIQLRELETRLAYLRELEERREVILRTIDEMGKLSPDLRLLIVSAQTKQVLEDLYLPYKSRRRTKAQIAKEAGLEPLADKIFQNPELNPQSEAQLFLDQNASGTLVANTPTDNPPFLTVQAVLDGVRDILSERWAEDAGLLQTLREWLWQEGLFQSKKVSSLDESTPEVAKFRDYFDYNEPLSRVPSHRALAIFRGRSLEFLEVKLIIPSGVESSEVTLAEARIALHLHWQHLSRPADDLIRKCIAWTWRVKLSLSIERDLFAKLKEQSEGIAIKVFADNLRDLLLAAPAGPKAVMGLDPGIRTGVKVAVIDATGRLVETATVYPHEPRRDWEGSLHTLRQLCQKHNVELIAIGNGTASRETDKLAGEVIKQLLTLSNTPTPINKVVVSESGASVYSASELASQEMPDVDVSLRGAASIARRLQDPLAELVKIDPKSIGVGQYQHDVNQLELSRTLGAVIEDCVNAVGVDLNTASVPLLSHVSGLSKSVAQSMVRWREKNGAFANRQQLLSVTGLGGKTFELAAGFLRIRNGNNPLDMTGVHPETYPVVEHILVKTGSAIQELMGRTEKLKSLSPSDFVTPQFGVMTIKDILLELEKPGRDPRPDFQVARYSEGVEDIKDLKVDMILEGTVSNVAQFGAFVDLGVHQDGLVHVSQLADKYVTDAREIVKTGDVVKVKVLEVDINRKRISLTMKISHKTDSRSTAGVNKFQNIAPSRNKNFSNDRSGSSRDTVMTSSMASAFAKIDIKR